MQKKASELKSKLADPALSLEMCKAGNADLVALCNIETQVRERMFAHVLVVACCISCSPLYVFSHWLRELLCDKKKSIDLVVG